MSIIWRSHCLSPLNLPAQNRLSTQLNFEMLRLKSIALLSVFFGLFVSISRSIPTQNPTEVATDPKTAAAQILKLACEKAEKLKQDKKAKGDSRKEMPIQEKDAPRHDRKWATSKKTKKESSTAGS